MVFGLFLANRENIRASIESIRNGTGRPVPAEGSQEEDVSPEPAAPEPPAQAAAAPEPAVPPPQPAAAPAPLERTAPREEPPPARPRTPASAAPAPETRERVLYFTQVDREGAVLRVKAPRKLPVSASPLADSLAALIAGPSPEELRRGCCFLPRRAGGGSSTCSGA